MPKRNLALIAVLIAAAAACWFILPRIGRDRQTVVPPERQVQPFTTVYGHLDNQYVHSLNDEQRRRLMDQAIRSAIESLGDGYSEFIAPELASAYLKDTLRGEFSGIGIELELCDHAVTVVGVVEGSPAFAVGIAPGDQIVRVGDRDVARLGAEEVAQLIRGQPGSEVVLCIIRPNVGEIGPLAVARTQIVRHPVKGFRPGVGGGWDFLLPRSAGSHLGYIRVSEFVETDQGSTAGLFAAAVSQAMTQGATGLILDVRGNPGGAFSQALKVVEQFVADGVIVEERGAHRRQVYRATSPGAISRLPIVVLINGGTASAAEIVAGSLAVNRRAVLVGERTFGKGTMQQMVPINMGDGREGLLKLTVAYLYLPDGYAFDRKVPPPNFRQPDAPAIGPAAAHRGGVKPTLAIELSPSEIQMIARCRRELEFPSPPEPTTGPTTSPPPTAPTTTPDQWAEQLYRLDRQLIAAVAVLSSPARYHALLARAPTTAPEQDDDKP